MEIYEIGSNIFQTVALGTLLFLSIRLLLKNTGSLTAVFLSFFYALWFLSDVYWLVYDVLRANVRMPFAANEIGEAGMILMMAATLNSAVPHGSRAAIKQMICAAVFAAFNAVLWIAWSGEWVQDIITGLVFMWLLMSAVCSLKVVRALSKTEWMLLGFYSAALIAGQGLTFLFEDPVKSGIDKGCYVLLSLGILYWAVKLILAYKRKAPAKKMMSLAVSTVVWISVALYMSAGVYYTVFLILETIATIFIYLTARKVVNES